MGKKRRYDHPKRQADKHADVMRRLQSDESPIIDIAFVKLFEELQQWPDGWRVDPHGDPHGNNPHVWLPIKSGYVLLMKNLHSFKIKIDGLRQFPGMRAPQPGAAVHAWSLVDIGELRCTCGMVKSDYDLWLETLVPHNVMRAYLDGLVDRDVQ